MDWCTQLIDVTNDYAIQETLDSFYNSIKPDQVTSVTQMNIRGHIYIAITFGMKIKGVR